MSTAPPSHEAILASAGCGKTQALSTRYIGLLLRGIPPDRILALTFTRAAAGEMTERIMLRLAAAVQDAAARRSLRDDLALDALSAEQASEALGSMLAHLHRLRISTLDSFFLEIVKAFALELGVPVQTEIMDEYGDARVRAAALRAVFSAARTSVPSFNDLSAVFSQLTFGGESRRVAERLTAAIDDAFALYLDAPSEAWSAFPPVTAPFDDASWRSCLDACAAHPLTIANDKYRQVLERARQARWEELLKTGPSAKVADKSYVFNRKPLTAQEIELLEPLVRQAHAKLIEPARQRTRACHAFLEQFDAAFTSVKRARGALTFNDIALLLRHRLSPSPGGDGLYVYYRLDGTIDHMLIDEFQDTSILQWTDIEPLAAEILAARGERSLFLVGDIKQAIYGWRGGCAALLRTIISHYNHGAQGGDAHILEHQLVKSYRSGTDILGAVNAVFGAARGDVARWRDQTQFQPHESAVDHSSYAELRTVEADEDTARYHAVALLLKAIEPWKRGLSAAVLCRTNDAVRDALDILKQEGIPAFSRGKSRLTENAAVQLVLSIFRLADQPRDGVSAYQALTSPCAALWPWLVRDRLAGLDSLRIRLAYSTHAAVVEELVEPLRPRVDEATRQALDQLVDLAAAFEPWAAGRPSDFVSFVEQAAPQDPAASVGVVGMTIHAAKGLGFDMVVLPELEGSYKQAGARQQIYTRTASAAGLLDLPEVSQILVAPKKCVELVDENFRAMVEERERQQEQEFLNTLYVALTRAKRGLYMIVSQPKAHSAGELLLAALGGAGTVKQPRSLAGIPGAIQYAAGAPEWFTDASGAQAAAPPEAGPAAVALRDSATRRRPHRTPSSEERVVLADRARWFGVGSRAAAETGTLVHAMFSAVAWLDDAAIAQLRQRKGDAFDSVLACARRAAPGMSDEHYEAGFQRFCASLDKPGVTAALARPAAQCEVACELPFATLVANAVVAGRCDRVVFFPSRDKPERIDIVDFKTDRISSGDDLRRAVERYEPQLEHYRAALSAVYGVAPRHVSAHVLFV
ncbi:UvrD-helicase domain-containing protein [bacterium]|nr:UvrD-helicase domain-containing protein [bacterium]